MPNTQNVYLRNIPVTLWKQIKMAALEDDKNVRDVVIEALQYWLEQKAHDLS